MAVTDNAVTKEKCPASRVDKQRCRLIMQFKKYLPLFYFDTKSCKDLFCNLIQSIFLKCCMFIFKGWSGGFSSNLDIPGINILHFEKKYYFFLCKILLGH
jgi:hypothetical protein